MLYCHLPSCVWFVWGPIDPTARSVQKICANHTTDAHLNIANTWLSPWTRKPILLCRLAMFYCLLFHALIHSFSVEQLFIWPVLFIYVYKYLVLASTCCVLRARVYGTRVYCYCLLCTVILIFKGPETFQTQSHFFGITKFRNGSCVIIGCTMITDAMTTFSTMMPSS